ncbi:hypothetical protein BC941DRAFT_411346 [Chlamydoabsidia padenii]|nr:hypothetical protein BC941DRAFT_411346 [Chlamydoabsidia padenii]
MQDFQLISAAFFYSPEGIAVFVKAVSIETTELTLSSYTFCYIFSILFFLQSVITVSMLY